MKYITGNKAAEQMEIGVGISDSKKKTMPGFIFEFKFTKDEKVDIVKTGIAFCGKRAVVKR